MSNRDYEYHSNISKICKVQFSLLSPEEIKNQSACKIIDHTLYTPSQEGISIPSPGGLYNLKMGAIDSNVICETCEQRSSLCPGHFGYIELAAPVFHMHFMTRILKLLKCICFRCSKLLLSDEELIVDSKDIYEKFDIIYEKSKKKKICGCVNGCGSIQPTRYTREGIGKLFAEWIYKDKQDNKKVLVKPDYVLNIFKRITDEDCLKLGFSPQFCRPEWLICTVLPVPPPAVRPSVKQDNNQRSDDDLTYKLIDIVKANAKLQEKLDSGQTDYIDEHITVIQYHVATLINNDQPFGAGVPQANVQRSGRTLKSLQQRVKSKDGRIRGNLMGKRVDYSARSVITPDPFIDIDELGVPINIAKNLTFPEKVTKYNIDNLKKYILNGYDNWPGAKSVKKCDEDSIKNLKHVDLNKIVDELQIGDIVNRHLVDGDIVLFNRQPSLHKMSMMAHRIKIMKANTFRLNVCVTSPYNADFDGDEMNMHVPQSYQTYSELKNLCLVPTQIISPQEGKPVIALVQDALLGASRLTLTNDKLRYIMPYDVEENNQFLFNKKLVMNLMMWNKSFYNMNNLKSLITHNDCNYYTGKQIFSTVLPEINVKNSAVKIKHGYIEKGYLVKKNLGTSSGSLIHTIYNDLGKDAAASYLNNCQGITNNFLLNTGFSVGISDLIINKNVVNNLSSIINDKKNNVNQILLDIQNGLLEKKYHTSLNEEFETLVTQELNTATDEVGKLRTDMTYAVLDSVKWTSIDSQINGGSYLVDSTESFMEVFKEEFENIKNEIDTNFLEHVVNVIGEADSVVSWVMKDGDISGYPSVEKLVERLSYIAIDFTDNLAILMKKHIKINKNNVFRILLNDYTERLKNNTVESSRAMNFLEIPRSRKIEFSQENLDSWDQFKTRQDRSTALTKKENEDYRKFLEISTAVQPATSPKNTLQKSQPPIPPIPPKNTSSETQPDESSIIKAQEAKRYGKGNHSVEELVDWRPVGGWEVAGDAQHSYYLNRPFPSDVDMNQVRAENPELIKKLNNRPPSYYR